MRPGSVWGAGFLRWLDEADDPPTNTEAEWAGEWKVVSFAEDRHLVLRGWEDPTQDEALGSFLDRSVALLCAAVLPIEARPTLFAHRTLWPSSSKPLVRPPFAWWARSSTAGSFGSTSQTPTRRAWVPSWSPAPHSPAGRTG